MRFWKGECSRAFTDWRGLQYGVGDGAWLIEDSRIDDAVVLLRPNRLQRNVGGAKQTSASLGLVHDASFGALCRYISARSCSA